MGGKVVSLFALACAVAAASGAPDPAASSTQPRNLSLLVVTVVWGQESAEKRFSEQHAINQAVGWYRAISGGALSFAVTYSPTVSIREESLHDNCWARVQRAGVAAKAALLRRGVDASAFDRVIYVIPALLINARTTPKQGCPISGMNIDSPPGVSGVGGPSVVLNGFWGVGPLIVEHELGHTLRLGHAGVDEFCPGCTRVEYGSRFSVMGEGQGLSGLERWYLGWLPATEPQPDGSLELSAFGRKPSVLVVRTKSGTYGFENRQPVGADAWFADTPVLFGLMPPGILVYKNVDTLGGMQAVIENQHPDSGLPTDHWTLQPGENLVMPGQYMVSYLAGADPAQLHFHWLDSTAPERPELIARDARRLTLRDKDVGTGIQYFEVTAGGETWHLAPRSVVTGPFAIPTGFSIPLTSRLLNQRHVRIVAVDYAGHRSPALFTRTYPEGFATGPQLSTNTTTPRKVGAVRLSYSTNPIGGTTITLRHKTQSGWESVGSRYVLTPYVRLRLRSLHHLQRFVLGWYQVQIDGPTIKTFTLPLHLQAAHGGAGLVTQAGVVGPLRLDTSGIRAVTRFAGTPDADVIGTFEAPAGYGTPTFRALGYDCSRNTHHGGDPGAYRRAHVYCRTIYYINPHTDKLAAFWTLSPHFHTSAGTHPGMPQQQADRREHQWATGSARPAITKTSNVATLVLINAGGRITITSPNDPYRWVGGTVAGIGLESRHHPVGLLFV